MKLKTQQLANTFKNIEIDLKADLARDVLSKLAYFGVFQHPLSQRELAGFLTKSVPESELKNVLEHLVEKEIIFQYKKYFGIFSNVEQQVADRFEKEIYAQKLLKKLPRFGRIISAFPFVRAVALSGSLSKGVSHADGDIDYFIITKHNRMWLARTLLVFFKKTVLFNSRKHFCVNYFLSEKNLAIPDKNVFTAIEISTLLPISGNVDAFFAANPFVKKWVHKRQPTPFLLPEIKTNFKLKTAIEKLLNGKFGEWLDKKFMRITLRHWKKKFSDFNDEKFALALRTSRNTSKHHPNDFQTRVLQRYGMLKNELILKIEPEA